MSDFFLFRIFYESFHNHKNKVLVALYISFGAAICLATDIIGDIIYSISVYDDKKKMTFGFSIDTFERAIVLGYTIIANVVLYYYLDSNAIFSIFLYIHMLQHIAYLAVVHALCVKLRPEYFAKKIIIVALITMAVLGFMMIASCNDSDPFSIYFIFQTLTLVISYSILAFYWLNYIYHVFWLRGKDQYTVHDISILIYLIISIVILTFLPFICAAIVSFSMRMLDINETLIFTYTNILFNVLMGSTPGRIRSYMLTLRKKNEIETKKNILRFMCHEIRSPLFVACSGLKLLDPSDLSANVSSILTDVNSELNAAVDLLNNLLEFEKYESAEINLRRDMVDHTVFIQTCTKCSILAKQRGMEYEVVDYTDRSNDNKYYLLVDSYKIEQVLRNLITNAVKYSTEGAKITVSINSVPSSRLPAKIVSGYSGNDLVISVKDTGLGIPLEVQAQVFQQFKQFTVSSLGGTGIGLWISKTIAELHDGALTFYSAGLNQGSTFSLVLPLHEEILYSSSEKSSTIASTSPDDIEPPCNFDTPKTVNILIADDSVMNRKYINRLLTTLLLKEMNSMLHPIITEVDDGTGAVSHVKNSPVRTDVIFMDNIMKVMHGPEASKELRAIGFNGTIVGVSGNVLQDDINSFLKSGATYFLNKPIDSKQLLSIMRTVYGKLPSPDNV
jgi:signal transduction histidine kinase/CheY-like chemotaxis protein